MMSIPTSISRQPEASLDSGSQKTLGVLEVEHLRKTFGSNVVAVSDFSLTIQRDEIVCFLGPSGCGKTTILRMLVGLAEPDSGRISYANERLFDSELGVYVPAHRRHFGMVFQSYALWPHMSVLENVAYALRPLRLPAAERSRRAEMALTSVGLEGLSTRRVGELSGGQQQRVAVARSVVAHPRMVFFDEPLSNLDANLRTSMRRDIREIMKNEGLSGIYVTHDQAEAFAVADRIVVLKDGVVRQVGAPLDLASSPRDAFVARFLRAGAVLAVTCVGADIQRGRLLVRMGERDDTWLVEAWPETPPSSGDSIDVCVPPEAVALVDPDAGIPGKIEWAVVQPHGGWEVGVAIDGQVDEIVVGDVPSSTRPSVGDACGLGIVGGVKVLS